MFYIPVVIYNIGSVGLFSKTENLKKKVLRSNFQLAPPSGTTLCAAFWGSPASWAATDGWRW